MPTTNSSSAWADAESFGLADSVIVFAALALALETVWILAAELRPIADAGVRRIVLGAYAVCLLLTTVLFGVLAGKYDISAHLAGSSCELGVNACNMMGITLGMSAGAWVGALGFLVYASQRPMSCVGVVLSRDDAGRGDADEEQPPPRRQHRRKSAHATQRR